MEKFSDLSINVLEQSLLRKYYLCALSWEKFIENDKTPDIFKTERELMEKEFGKRAIVVAKKVCECAKSNIFNKYVKCYPPIFGYNNSADFEFNLTKYCRDEKMDVSFYNANLETEINVTVIKKACRTVKQTTEKKHVELTFSEFIIKLKESISEYIKVLATSGVFEFNYLPLDFDFSFGEWDNRNKNKIAELKKIASTEEIFNFNIKEESEGGEMTLATSFDIFTIVQGTDGKYKILSKHYGVPPSFYLTKTFFDDGMPKKEEIIELLAKYFSINVITLEEIEATLDSHPTKAEFNEWLEERLKTVVIPGERLIEKQS